MNKDKLYQAGLSVLALNRELLIAQQALQHGSAALAIQAESVQKELENVLQQTHDPIAFALLVENVENITGATTQAHTKSKKSLLFDKITQQ